MKNRFLFIVAFIVCIYLCGCEQTGIADSAANSVQEETNLSDSSNSMGNNLTDPAGEPLAPTPTNTSTPTNTPTPTNTSTPTNTPTPTNTSTPTNTTTPTNTPTPTDAPQPATNPDYFTYNECDGKIDITGYIGSDTDVVIPETINGMPVTSIGDYAFYECSNLSSIIIPDSVTSIGTAAFVYCSKLTSITIPTSVTNMGGMPFQETPWLENRQKDDPFVIVNNILIDGTTLSGSVAIPDGVTSIGSYAFYECSSLASISIPDSVTSIGHLAFYGCSSLTSMTIPEGVTSIGAAAFQETPWLENCKQENPFVVINNIFVDGTALSGKVTIPEGVTSISGYAFAFCGGLTSITIPEGVTSIGGYTFYGCDGLTSATIPDSVTNIDNHAFEKCKSLENIIVSEGSYAEKRLKEMNILR